MMITRLTHAAIAFAVTAVLYQAYVLAVAPFVEPAWRVEQAAQTAESELVVTPAEALHRYRDLLTAYFPPTHWCFAEPPKALDNGQALIIFSKEEKSANGQMTIPRCAVIFFPTPRQANGQPPRDAIILESTKGAILQMEAQGGALGFGKVQHGTLEGDVTIRSDMREPGSQDDLLLTTQQLNINEDGIHTLSPVDMRLGPHQGFGRELEIRFMKTEGSSGLGIGGIYGKFEELTVKHDVAVKVAPGKMSFFGEPSHEATAAAAAGTPAPPIHIQSAGPFRIDFAAEVASFTDQVQVRQTHPDGKRDDLQAAELKLFFTRTSKWNADDDGVTPTAAGTESMAFEPASIEALGAPVVLTAQSHDAAAEGGRLWIELGPQRLRLEGSEEVVLKHQGAEIHAPMVEYQLPPKGSGQQVGAMAARGGAGWMRAVVDPLQPSQVLEVRWTDAMQLVRREEKLVLVLDGRPRVSLAGTGTMWADQLEIFLRETAHAAPSGLTGGSPLAGSVVPELIKASGRVAIESPQLNGKINQLEVKFDHGNSLGNAAAAANGQIAATPISTGGNPLSMLNGAGGIPSGKAYNIEGVTLNLDVAMQGKAAAVRGISVDGAVDFKEASATLPGVEPMQIKAEHLNVTGADTPNAQIEIRGGGGQNGLPQQIAELTANGAKLRVPAIALQRGTSEAIVNAPGEVQLLVDRDMAGNPLARPEPLTITWQESMQLHGRELTFLGDVRVQHESGWLNTRRLVVRTVAPVNFDGGGQNPQVEQIECWEGVLAEFDQRDVSGVNSRQHLEVQSLQINQITGEIRGDGPGEIDSVHKAKGAGAFMAVPGGAATAPAAPRLMNEEVELRHLHVDFVRGVGGNLHSKTVKVIGNVEAVYGPIESWEQRLTMSPGGDPGPDTVWITCDELGVTESPMARINGANARQVELDATGNVVIEGQDKARKMFNATGGSARFDQSKGLFILEGSDTAPATITQQDYLGAPMSPQSAQRMQFNQNTGIVEIQGLHRGSFNQTPTGK